MTTLHYHLDVHSRFHHCHFHINGSTTMRRHDDSVSTRTVIANWVVGFTSGLHYGCSYTVLASWRRDLACHLQQELRRERFSIASMIKKRE